MITSRHSCELEASSFELTAQRNRWRFNDPISSYAILSDPISIEKTPVNIYTRNTDLAIVYNEDEQLVLLQFYQTPVPVTALIDNVSVSVTLGQSTYYLLNRNEMLIYFCWTNDIISRDILIYDPSQPECRFCPSGDDSYPETFLLAKEFGKFAKKYSVWHVPTGATRAEKLKTAEAEVASAKVITTPLATTKVRGFFKFNRKPTFKRLEEIFKSPIKH